MENTYWNKNGKYQAQYEALSKQIPRQGKAHSVPLDLLRNASSVYYDHHNNGDANWEYGVRLAFYHIWHYADELAGVAQEEGIRDFDKFMESIEASIQHQDDTPGLDGMMERLANIVIRYAAACTTDRQE